MESSRTALRIIFFILLLDIMGVSLLWPVAAFIVQQYSNDAIMLTVLTALYSAAQFFAAPFMGRLGDSYGRRPVLIISLLGSCIGYIMFGVGGALWVLLISRLLDGFTAGNQSVAGAYIADVSTPETRAKNFTLFGMAWGVALVAGPALGAVFGEISLAAPAFLAATLCLLAALLSYFYLPESLARENRNSTPIKLADINPFTTIIKLLSKPVLGSIFVVLILFNFVFNGFSSTESLYLVEKFSATPLQLGGLLTFAGLSLVAIQKILPPLIKRFGHQRVAVVSLIALAIMATITSITPAFNLLFGVVSLRTMAAGFLFPILGALMSSMVTPKEQGALMGVNTALHSATYVFGPIWAGLVYDHLHASSPYWLGAVILLLTALYLSRVRLSPVNQPLNKPNNDTSSTSNLTPASD
ncbi:tetracycline resistance MFS efflux pump [Saccharophagus degradans]|uniref:Major facilitator superfamily MFS_1 n=1 Tax=Saccharophagus degradans (strain 2-40 / ATCC 43961 / DSM 17024) TaxID=203122 RepID=Q21E97_SACD2|nr:tetracycline resistance MFS efflux pump [Saccharophagus degradans]ABD82982.1 major facilitator superfamily MFS_1 [Saccharophagus degradans 2-40]